MTTPRNANFTQYNAVQLAGETETINSVSVVGLEADPSGNLLYCQGLTVPTNGSSGYAKGCTFIKTDAVSGTSGVYENVGTNTSCIFTIVSPAPASFYIVAAGKSAITGTQTVVTVSGAVATDVALASIQSASSSTSIVGVLPGTGNVTISTAINGGTGTLSYVLHRAV